MAPTKTGAFIKTLPAHTVLHIGLTDLPYQILDATHDEEQKKFWGQYNIDHIYLPMNHFDLVIPKNASDINEKIVAWL